MKRSISIFLMSMCVFQLHAQTDAQTHKDIETVCNYYLDGGTNGDSIMFSKAFRPEGQMLFMRNDTMQIVSLKDFMARIHNTHQKVNRTAKIESIQVFGDAAVAILSIETETASIHDIMSLLKTKEGWKIVGKIFSREMKMK